MPKVGNAVPDLGGSSYPAAQTCRGSKVERGRMAETYKKFIKG